MNQVQLNLQQHLGHLWERLKHENDMLNHRLSWLWTLQGFLFASFGLLSKEMNIAGKIPISIICAVGICSCFSVGYSVQKGHQVLDVLHLAIKNIANKIEADLILPQTPIVEPDFLAFLHPWRFLPWTICGAWIVLLWWVYE